MLNTILLQIAVNQQETMATDTVATEVQQTLSALDLAIKGGWIMLILGMLCVITFYLFFERFMAIKKASKEDVNFMNRIKDYIHEGKIDSATSLCQSTQSPISNMIDKGISRLGRPLNDITTTIENVGNLEIAKLEKGLPTLATISGGAPMIGFLGTVIGMIKAFYDMSQAGNNIDVSLLSGGIYTAMVTTVGGLIVGIIAYFAYNYLVARVESVVHKMEASTTEFMDLLNEPVK